MDEDARKLIEKRLETSLDLILRGEMNRGNIQSEMEMTFCARNALEMVLLKRRVKCSM
jgi:hypothetical protein